jgi:two-component sensor histidine kinase
MSTGTTVSGGKPEPRDERHVPPWLPRFVSGIPPYSIRAVGIAVLCFVSALAVQVIARSVGGSLMFAPYYPAVLAAGLLGGLPAGIVVTIAALLTVWWAIMPPQFAFMPLNLRQSLDIATYLLSAGCILALTEYYRAALRELHKREQERELVMKELEHRGRNTYAVIDAIIQRTFEDQPERANIASGRIRAVKYANDLVNETSTHTVLLKTLLLHEFTPYEESRLHAEGPDVELSSDVARHLVLVFHELVTNAVKYGALSKLGGRVLISWKAVDGVVRLEWREEGGPLVKPPQKHGFGSRLVTQSLKSISGSITPTFAPRGLHCSITFRAPPTAETANCTG